MTGLQPYSERTKRRKVAAEVSKVVAEALVEESIGVPVCSALCNFSELSFPDTGFNIVAEACDNHFVCESNSADKYNLDDSSNLDFGYHGSSVADFDTDGKTLDTEDMDFTDDIDWRAHAIEEFSDDEGSSDSEMSSLHDSLADWATTYNISQNALSDLLKILQPSLPMLPKDARTLLNTERSVEVKAIAGGEYYYFGIKFWLQTLLKTCSFASSIESLTLHANIDGIPLSKSSNVCLWPILCSIAEIRTVVFPVAVFCSSHKPDSVNAYLNDFVSEIKALEQYGFSVPDSVKHYRVKLGAVICDAPACAMFKCVKGHNAYNCCERCIQHGDWLGKIILPSFSAPLRTDEEFISRKDYAHHTAVSPFTELQFGMVSNFPLDYMHLICLGVVRRLVHLWVHGPHTCKLSHCTLSAISDKMQGARSYIPREFSRKPRSLLEYKLWKATELRLFLVYTGPVILKGFLLPEVYSNFLDLSVAVRLLLSPSLVEHYVDYADQLLRYFAVSFCRIYGKDLMVYNVHSLIHIADDARKFGVLDNVSAFKYESFLGRLKKLVRRPQSPCTQIVRRILEGHGQSNFLEKPASLHAKTFARPHMEGPTTIAMSHCQQYKQYHGDPYFISVGEGDNCFEVGGKIGLVRNILKDSHSCTGYVVFEEFTAVDSFFIDPLDSKHISICFVSRLAGTTVVFPLAHVNAKYVKLPFKHGFVVMPQMHFN